MVRLETPATLNTGNGWVEKLLSVLLSTTGDRTPWRPKMITCLSWVSSTGCAERREVQMRAKPESRRKLIFIVVNSLRTRRRLALKQVAHTVKQLRILDDKEQSAAAVLTAGTIRSRERALLIHVAKNDIRLSVDV